ncbi:VOC family protein [Ferdinandcohnia quinoae]|uniref:VOC family protein n=1 Tax=Fredinandcohnia quinoae TaxID=2918902 RepID=A0AAW5E464_9BACI|nr:VOC family protein [Fredinandcohnia sp. SECRCQ15]MCH1626045.1 VOC family protein [Fredinandcohnia sp. SECRCQ15]
MRLHHIGIEVRNIDEGISFYTTQLNFRVENHFTFMDEEIVFLTSKDFRIELIATQEKSSTVNNHTHTCFEVRNLDEIMKSFNNVPIVEGPYTLENGWKTVFYKGPHGEIIEFLQTVQN